MLPDRAGDRRDRSLRPGLSRVFQLEAGVVDQRCNRVGAASTFHLNESGLVLEALHHDGANLRRCGAQALECCTGKRKACADVDPQSRVGRANCGSFLVEHG